MKISIWINIRAVSETLETVIEVSDDATEEEIETAAKDAAFEFIEWGYEKIGMKIFVDYFLRYTADVPADEAARHQKFSRHCPCKPEVVFDDLIGWHTLTHHALEK